MRSNSAAPVPPVLLDRLADAGLGDVEPPGGPADVQLLGQSQEDPDVPQLQPPLLPSDNPKVITKPTGVIDKAAGRLLTST